METPATAHYPSVRYHRTGATRVVNDHAEHTDLVEAGEWADTPAAFPPAPAPTSCATCGRSFDEPAAPSEDATDAATDASDAATPAKTKAKKPAAK